MNLSVLSACVTMGKGKEEFPFCDHADSSLKKESKERSSRSLRISVSIIIYKSEREKTTREAARAEWQLRSGVGSFIEIKAKISGTDVVNVITYEDEVRAPI